MTLKEAQISLRYCVDLATKDLFFEKKEAEALKFLCSYVEQSETEKVKQLRAELSQVRRMFKELNEMIDGYAESLQKEAD
jgi:hypothetical protein